MRDLNYELKQLCRRNRDGSYATQRDRERVLDLVANQLHDLGYRHLAAASLKPKHVEGLVERWQAEGLAVGTIKNRMAELRWWAEKIGKQNVIARDNDHYGIGNRQYVTNVSKARQLTGGELARITDPYTAMSLRLQAAFGLRRGESIKIRPEWADRGDRLALKDTWTKGGRPREIPIRNAEQRQVLDEAKALAGRGSLIPAERSYVEQLRRFEYQCAAAGAHRIHGQPDQSGAVLKQDDRRGRNGTLSVQQNGEFQHGNDGPAHVDDATDHRRRTGRGLGDGRPSARSVLVHVRARHDRRDRSRHGPCVPCRAQRGARVARCWGGGRGRVARRVTRRRGRMYGVPEGKAQEQRSVSKGSRARLSHFALSQGHAAT